MHNNIEGRRLRQTGKLHQAGRSHSETFNTFEEKRFGLLFPFGAVPEKMSTENQVHNQKWNRMTSECQPSSGESTIRSPPRKSLIITCRQAVGNPLDRMVQQRTANTKLWLWTLLFPLSWRVHQELKSPLGFHSPSGPWP